MYILYVIFLVDMNIANKWNVSNICCFLLKIYFWFSWVIVLIILDLEVIERGVNIYKGIYERDFFLIGYNEF